jgi:dienelactone hydrolase
VLLLHWGGKNYRYIGRDILELLGIPAFSELQAIIVAPDRKRKHWATPQALNDLDRLVNYLIQQYNLDPYQRVVAGFSMGGGGVWFIGAEAPSLFACGISIASPIPEDIIASDWSFPVYSIHGFNDEIFPHDLNFGRAQALKENGAPIEFETVEGTMHTDIKNYVDAFGNARNWVKKVWGDFESRDDK